MVAGCYQVMSYHFGKHLMSQTTMFKRIFKLGLDTELQVTRRGHLGGQVFLELAILL